jgi:hypothetical protein
MAVGFSRDDAKRIGVVVKRVEHSPLGARSYRSKHKIYRGTGGGSDVRWAKITAVTDAKNYTGDIYYNRDGTAEETGVAVKAFDIVDSLAVNDWIPVIEYPHGTPTATDYWTCSQQLGLL